MDKSLISDYLARSARINELFKHDLFFISGAPKSGTTWFQRLLDTHPEIVCSGEGHFAESLLKPFNKLAHQYNEQQKISAKRVYEDKPYYQGLKSQEIDFICRTIVGAIMSQRRIPEGIKCVGDKTPRHSLHMDLLAHVFPEAKFVNIVRDGRDVITSTCHHAFRAGHTSAIDKTRPEYFNMTEKFANVWVNNVRSAEEFGRKNPDKYISIRYEDMLDKPEETLSQIFRFLNVDKNESIIKECIEKNDFKTLTGRERGTEDKNSYFRTGTYGGWKEFLSPGALKQVYSIAGETLIQMGYEAKRLNKPQNNVDVRRKKRNSA